MYYFVKKCYLKNRYNNSTFFDKIKRRIFMILFDFLSNIFKRKQPQADTNTSDFTTKGQQIDNSLFYNNDLRIFEDCVNLITNSKNKHTVEGRYLTLSDSYNRLLKYKSEISNWDSIKNKYEELIANRNSIMDKFSQTAISNTTNSQKADCDYIKELSESTKNKSDILYNEYIKEISSFDPLNIDKTMIENLPLTSAERNFLSYMSGRKIHDKNIAQYWKYDYKINFYFLMSRFFNEDYLRLSSGSDVLSSLKTIDLKEILKAENLPISGKKAVLIERIIDNTPIDRLNILLGDYDKIYTLTSKGFETVHNIKKSATKNIDLEDECIQLILNGDFDKAYKKIQKYFRGSAESLSVEYTEVYSDLMENSELWSLPELGKHTSLFKACVILGIMLGIDCSKTLKLISRIDDIDIDKNLLLDEIHYLQAMLLCKINIKQFKNLGVKEIEVLSDIHNKNCSKHNGQIIKTVDAQPGKNLPPFNKKCNCTIIPHRSSKF